MVVVTISTSDTRLRADATRRPVKRPVSSPPDVPDRSEDVRKSRIRDFTRKSGDYLFVIKKKSPDHQHLHSPPCLTHTFVSSLVRRRSFSSSSLPVVRLRFLVNMHCFAILAVRLSNFGNRVERTSQADRTASLLSSPSRSQTAKATSCFVPKTRLSTYPDLEIPWTGIPLLAASVGKASKNTGYFFLLGQISIVRTR